MGHGEGRGVRRMAVDHAHDVGPGLVDRQVQEHLAGALLGAGQLLALGIDLANVLGLHVALGHHGRRTQELAVVEADRDVAVVGRRETAVVQAPADLTHKFFVLLFCHGCTMFT